MRSSSYSRPGSAIGPAARSRGKCARPISTGSSPASGYRSAIGPRSTHRPSTSRGSCARPGPSIAMARRTKEPSPELGMAEAYERGYREGFRLGYYQGVRHGASERLTAEQQARRVQQELEASLEARDR